MAYHPTANVAAYGPLLNADCTCPQRLLAYALCYSSKSKALTDLQATAEVIEQ